MNMRKDSLRQDKLSKHSNTTLNHATINSIGILTQEDIPAFHM